MAYLKKLKNNELIGGIDNTDVYPITTTHGVYSPDNKTQQAINDELIGRVTGLELTEEELIESLGDSSHISYWSEVDIPGGVIPIEIEDDTYTGLLDTDYITLDDIPDGNVYQWTKYATKVSVQELMSTIASLTERVAALEARG